MIGTRAPLTVEGDGEEEELIVVTAKTPNQTIVAEGGALFYFNSDTWLQSLSSSLLQLDARLTLAQQEAINPIVTLLVRDGLKVTINASQLTDRQIGVILKVFQEAHQSGKLDTFLKQYTANGNDVSIHVGSKYTDRENGNAQTAFAANEFGKVQYFTNASTRSDGTYFPAPNATVYVSINSAYASSDRSFAKILIHELSHPFEPGDSLFEEDRIEAYEDRLYHEIFQNEANGESDPLEYFRQQRISISGHSETVNGGPGRDHVTGGLGSDQIHGGGGSDLLIGGLGDDLLDGGAGRDFMDGGMGDDLYVVAADLPDVVADTGGFDTVRVEAFIDWAALRAVRIEDDILIYSEATGDLVYLNDYAQPAGRIEQFDFAGTLVDASIIDQLADGGGSGIDPIILHPLIAVSDPHAFG
jgi:hypothetical protein